MKLSTLKKKHLLGKAKAGQPSHTEIQPSRPSSTPGPYPTPTSAATPSVLENDYCKNIAMIEFYCC